MWPLKFIILASDVRGSFIYYGRFEVVGFSVITGTKLMVVDGATQENVNPSNT
jgi:hypothetical protein